jgi:HPt (histidine-containing phosphotransfer) domain-containing protein
MLLAGLSSDLPTDLAALELAIEQGDVALARRKANNIKGLAASGGAQQLAASARELEKFCHEGMLQEAVQRLPGLKRHGELALVEWQNFLVNHSSAREALINGHFE